MKSLIVTAVAAVFALVPVAHADGLTRGAAQTSPIVSWNRVALDALARGKPTQHEAMRLLAYVSLAQYAALADAQTDAAARHAVATVTTQVIAGLLPAQAAYVEAQRERLQAQAPANEHGQRVAQRALAQARDDGFPGLGRGSPADGACLAQPRATPCTAGLSCGGWHAHVRRGLGQ